MSSKKTCAIEEAMQDVLMGEKCATLDNLSIVTMIQSCHHDDIGNPMMKSIDMVSHFHSRMVVATKDLSDADALTSLFGT